MKNNTNKLVGATGIGAALFAIIAMFVKIPIFANTNISLQYAVQALFSIIYGPGVGFLIGFIGHMVNDLFGGYGIWWSWVLPSGLVGLGVGCLRKFLKVDKGLFTVKDMLTFNIVQILTNFLAWAVIAPLGDIIIYSEPANKVFTQGLIAGFANALTVGIGGTILIAIYAKTRVQSGSLTKD